MDRHNGSSTLKDVLKERGWSYRELAQRSGVGFATIGEYARGEKATPKTVRKIAAALGVPLGIRLLEAYGLDYMVDDFRHQQTHPQPADPIVETVIERLRPEIRETIQEEIRDLLASLTESRRVMPGYVTATVLPFPKRPAVEPIPA